MSGLNLRSRMLALHDDRFSMTA